MVLTLIDAMWLSEAPGCGGPCRVHVGVGENRGEQGELYRTILLDLTHPSQCSAELTVALRIPGLSHRPNDESPKTVRRCPPPGGYPRGAGRGLWGDSAVGLGDVASVRGDTRPELVRLCHDRAAVVPPVTRSERKRGPGGCQREKHRQRLPPGREGTWLDCAQGQGWAHRQRGEGRAHVHSSAESVTAATSSAFELAAYLKAENGTVKTSDQHYTGRFKPQTGEGSILRLCMPTHIQLKWPK